MLRLLALAILALTSCSGQRAQKAQPRPIGDPGLAPHPADARPDAQECDELIAHAIALGMFEERGKPPTRVPTDEQQQQVTAELRAKFRPSCLAMPRRSYQCAIVASTLATLAACDQPTLSSSTSNSSVAPPGITPPAPRSP